jgi:small subunit ribosomal protein S20
MAHHKSAQKRIRQTETRTATNRARKTQIKTLVKKAETAIASGNKKEAAEALRAVQPALMKGVGKGVVKKATASRKMSRLNARVKAL